MGPGFHRHRGSLRQRPPHGVIVIDTGPWPGHPVIDQLYAPEVISIVDVLNTAGIDERDVTALINTHLHFDHCGQNHLLDHAPIWITQAELDVSTTEFYTVPEWAEIEPDRLRLASDGEAIADGVTILHTPGHTPGHLSITVTTDTGLEIIVGQACYTCAEYEAAPSQRPTCTHPTGRTPASTRSPASERSAPSEPTSRHVATTYPPEPSPSVPRHPAAQAPSLQRKNLRHICRSCGPADREMPTCISPHLVVAAASR